MAAADPGRGGPAARRRARGLRQARVRPGPRAGGRLRPRRASAASPASPRRRPAPWVRSQGCAWWRWPASVRARSAPWCSPTSVPTSSGSIAPRRRRRPATRPGYDVLDRGRRSVAVDLKAAGGAEVVLRLVERADALLEGFRPGVAERLGIGPDAVPRPQPAARLRADDRLGPGRSARPTPPATTSPTPRSPAPSPTSVAPASCPTPPLNLVADFGGGGMLLALGLVAGLLHARAHRRGPGGRRRDGRRHRAAHGAVLRRQRRWASGPTSGAPTCSTPARRSTTSTAAPTARSSRSAPSSRSSSPPCSTCSSSTPASLPDQNDRARWPELRAALDLGHRRPAARRVARAGRGHATPASRRCSRCAQAAAPPAPPGPAARSSSADGVPQPAPAPRFSATPGRARPPAGRARPAHRRGARRLGLHARRRSSALRRQPAPVA